MRIIPVKTNFILLFAEPNIHSFLLKNNQPSSPGHPLVVAMSAKSKVCLPCTNFPAPQFPAFFPEIRKRLWILQRVIKYRRSILLLMNSSLFPESKVLLRCWYPKRLSSIQVSFFYYFGNRWNSIAHQISPGLQIFNFVKKNFKTASTGMARNCQQYRSDGFTD